MAVAVTSGMPLYAGPKSMSKPMPDCIERRRIAAAEGRGRRAFAEQPRVEEVGALAAGFQLEAAESQRIARRARAR